MATPTFPDVHSGFQKSLKACFKANKIDGLKKTFEDTAGDANDKKTILDQAFRDEMLTDAIICNTNKMEQLITLSIAACREGIATSTIPVTLMSDIFDTVTLDQCERLFSYVESNVAIWKESWFFTTCKNNLLRMCNDLLKRFSRAQNTVFCGRILLFLATVFPFSERSGLNIISEFNLENLTEYEQDQSDDAVESVQSETNNFKVDYNLYCKFWALQNFFRNPNQCYDLNNWKKFSGYMTSVLSAFSSSKLEEQNDSVMPINANDSAMSMETDADTDEAMNNFFAKFLTNPKLLALQLSDAHFRRSVLVQCLILFQYLTSTVKFKTDAQSLTTIQNDFIKETEAEIYRLIEETPSNGKKFGESIRHMLKREELWNSWKNDGCKEFKPPEIPTDDQPKIPAKKPKRHLGDLMHDAKKQNKFFMGNTELTKLWNVCPDNLQACRGDDRNFLPPIDSYLDTQPDKADASYEWRALRLLARQSPLFFSLTPAPSKVADYLDTVRKKINEGKTKVKADGEPKNDNENDLMMEKDDGLVEDESEIEKADQMMHDDGNTHSRPALLSDDQMRELCGIIGADWEKLATKLGFKSDEVDFFLEEANAVVADACHKMIKIWLEDEEAGSCLEDLAYTMEGLKMLPATKCIKRFLEPADKMEDISE